MEWVTLWTAVSSIAVTFAACFAFFEVRAAADRSRTRFEDDLTREYRELMRTLPFEIAVGACAAAPPSAADERTIVQYLDLCNHQIYHRINGRVGRGTWQQWLQGIESNMKRPAFASTWSKVQSSTQDDFDELWMLLWPGAGASHPPFERDPRRWTSADMETARHARMSEGRTTSE